MSMFSLGCSWNRSDCLAALYFTAGENWYLTSDSPRGGNYCVYVGSQQDCSPRLLIVGVKKLKTNWEKVEKPCSHSSLVISSLDRKYCYVYIYLAEQG